ncbi:MAG: hypothetical protein ACERKO_13660 [Acetanaerobacterium sp.]
MNVSFEGYNERVITFAVQEDVQAGDLVSVSDSGTVEKAADGDLITGVARTVRGGFAGVQVSGYASVAADGEVAVGWQTLVCDGENGMRPAGEGGGRQLLVVEIGSGTAGILLG